MSAKLSFLQFETTALANIQIFHIFKEEKSINAMKMLMIKQLMFVGIDIVWRLGCSIDKARERGGRAKQVFTVIVVVFIIVVDIIYNLD